MKSNYKKLSDYIRIVDERNKDNQITRLLGVSIEKKFIESIANTIGTDMSIYKIVKRGQFAYGPVTSRNGDKVSIALLEEEKCIISSSYSVFEIIDTKLLLPEYLNLWFKRPEFDRYARFHSHGSAREIFDWEEMCNVELPVPDIDEQKKIVEAYSTIERRIELKRQINDNLEATMKTLYKAWFIDFEPFQDVIDADTNLPKDWYKGKLTSLMDYAGGQQPPAEQFVFEPRANYIRLVQIRDYETDKYATYIPESKKNKLCNEMDIMIARYGVSLGRICFGLSGAYNVALAKVFPHKEIYREYLRCFLKTDTFYNGINGSGERSAQQGFNQDGMDEFEIIIPTDSVFEKFNTMLTPIVKKQLQIKKSLKYLTQIQEFFLASLSR